MSVTEPPRAPRAHEALGSCLGSIRRHLGFPPVREQEAACGFFGVTGDRGGLAAEVPCVGSHRGPRNGRAVCLRAHGARVPSGRLDYRRAEAGALA